MKKVFFFFTVLMFCISCSKQHLSQIDGGGLGKESPEQIGKIFCLEGTIDWDADPGTDGYGWHFSALGVGQKTYVFDNLSTEYQIKGLPVTICMYKTNNRFSSLSLDPIYKHHITSIKRR